MRNLELAFPEKSVAERERILKGVYRSLGRLLAEIAKFPDYTLENVDRIAVYDGLENYLAARDRGKGVLFMTAHLGGWEIGSFVHSLHGHWLNIVVRKLDNPLLDRWVLQSALAARQPDSRQGRVRARAAGGDEARRDRGRADGHQHDSAAGSVS